MKITSIAGFVLLCSALVSAQTPRDPIEQLRRDFVYGTLALSPATATQTGYHKHQGRSLDSQMDDVSAAGMQKQRAFYKSFQQRITQAQNSSKLTAEDAADLRIIADSVGAALFELDDAETYAHNPTVYVELVGGALYSLSVFEYAPVKQRCGDMMARMKAVPSVFAAAKQNLKSSPEIWTTTAIDENEGNIGLIDQTLRQQCTTSMTGEWDKAAKAAIASMRDFNEWLKNDLSRRTADWRLGKEKFGRKFRYMLDTGTTPEQALADAEAEMKRLKSEMQKLAGDKSIKQYLDEIAAKHATPESYMKSAEDDLKQATEFVRAKNIVVVPDTTHLKVIETPEFMRGGYGVGGFAPAPVLEPNLQSSFWITPLSKDAARAESKLREYNNYGLQHLVVHEAMPGHWLQAEYAAQVQPESRRVLRGLFGNTPYVEGWAVYTQQLLSDAGYMKPDPGFQMTFYKQMLRVVSNTILDIRLQTMNMSDEDAMRLMTEDAFQEKEEATLKLQRAKLSQAQLCTYFVGWRGWNEVRSDEEKRLGKDFNEAEFHRKALLQGAVPLATLPKLLEGSK